MVRAVRALALVIAIASACMTTTVELVSDPAGDGGTSEWRCDGNEHCDIDCAGARRCEAVCTGTATCDIECDGAADCDELECQGTAACLVTCGSAATCGFAECTNGTPQSCPGGIIVCNRACP